MLIIDSHPHIYSADRKKFPTVPVPWEPGEPASAEDLKRKLDEAGVGRAVFIQTSTFYGFDNRYVMDSARRHGEWACGVVTLSPDEPSHMEVLEEGVRNHNIRGMRGIPDSINRISSPGVYRLWTRARDLGIVVNCMVMDDLERVPEIEKIAQDLPDLRVVIDHCLMLNTRHFLEPTLAALKRLSALPNLHAKLTCGTSGSYRIYPHPDMHDPLKRVIEWFTPDRCVWGSDFPNALWTKGTSYGENLTMFTEAMGLSPDEQEGILSRTALRLWFNHN